MPRPVLTHHARARCVEMGISTKVPKEIVENINLSFCPHRDRPERMAFSSTHPEYAVIYRDDEPGCPAVVITVMYRHDERRLTREQAKEIYEERSTS